MIEIFGTIATVLAVTGCVLNNRGARVCFLLWLVSNIICAVLHSGAGLWSLVVRDVLFSVLAVEGWIKWGKFKIKN